MDVDGVLNVGIYDPWAMESLETRRRHNQCTFCTPGARNGHGLCLLHGLLEAKARHPVMYNTDLESSASVSTQDSV